MASTAAMAAMPMADAMARPIVNSAADRRRRSQTSTQVPHTSCLTHLCSGTDCTSTSSSLSALAAEILETDVHLPKSL